MEQIFLRHRSLFRTPTDMALKHSRNINGPDMRGMVGLYARVSLAHTADALAATRVALAAVDPETPTHFTKPTTTLNEHGSKILKPDDCKYLNCEDEYAVSIDRTCHNVTRDKAWDHTEGLCPALGVGLQGLRDSGQGSMLRVKEVDTLALIDPGHRAPHHAAHRRQEPDGHALHSRSLEPGHIVECEITGIGRVGGTVVAIDASRAAAQGFGERVPEPMKENLRKTRRS